MELWNFGLIQNVGRLMPLSRSCPPPNHNFFNLNTNFNLNSSCDNVGTPFLLRVLRAWVGCGNLLKLEHSYVRWKKTINYNTQWRMVNQILWSVPWQCDLEIMVMQVHGNCVLWYMHVLDPKKMKTKVVCT